MGSNVSTYCKRCSESKTKHPYRLTAFIICILFAFGNLTGCSAVAKGIFDNILAERPTAADTETDLNKVARKLYDALKAGETSVTLNVVADNSEIKNISENMSSFWGWPDTYVIIKEYSNVNLSDGSDAKAVDVKKVEFNLVQSNNYYAYNAWKDSGFVIPEDKTEAIKVAESLKTIIPEIFGDKLTGSSVVEGTSSYDSALLVHDWLVANLVYDDTIEQSGTENGSYGALVGRKTMCQGYADSLQLILYCATDAQVEIVAGKGNSGDGNWIGHVWNLVYMDDGWYHVDATFDDPIGNSKSAINHYYFGQSDAVMSYDHNWDKENWEPSATGDFLWYRKNKLFTESKKGFNTIATRLLKGKKPKMIEIATRGFTLSEKDLQFVFDLNGDIDSAYHSETKVGDAAIIGLDLKYG